MVSRPSGQCSGSSEVDVMGWLPSGQPPEWTLWDGALQVNLRSGRYGMAPFRSMCWPLRSERYGMVPHVHSIPGCIQGPVRCSSCSCKMYQYHIHQPVRPYGFHHLQADLARGTQRCMFCWLMQKCVLTV